MIKPPVVHIITAEICTALLEVVNYRLESYALCVTEVTMVVSTR